MWRETVVLLATAAVGSSLYTHYVFPQVAYMSSDLHTRQGVKYDCPSEGFFINPTNCSQFYRCVDYTGSGQYFSVYAFECPQYNVFMLDGDNSTCIPGTECIGGTQTAAHVASSTHKPSVTTSQTVDINLPVSSSTGGLRPIPVRPSSTAQPVTDAPVTSEPLTTFAPITPAPVAPVPVTPSPVVANPAIEGDCHGQYVQHESFCNVYYKCSDSADKYLCPAGSVFDTERQMCRIQAAGEDLCGGKSIYSVSFRYVSGFNSATPQQIIQVPQSQPQYLNYFKSHQQVLNSNQQIPFHYVPSLTTQFIQAGLPQPALENNNPRMHYRVTNGKSQYQPVGAMVHPQQYYIPVDSELNADVVLPQPNPENIHPRMHYRVQPEPHMVHPRQYYVPIDSELNSDELY